MPPTPVRFVLDFGAAALVLAMGYVAGRALVPKDLVRNRLDRALLALGLGLFAQALATWIIGARGWWDLSAMLLLWTAVFAWQGHHAADDLSVLARDPATRDFLRRLRQPGPVFALAALGLLAQLAFNYSPPLSDDSTFAYLAFPLRYARGQAILPLHERPFSFFPHAVEMLYTQAMTLGTPLAGKLVNWMFLVLGVLAAARIAERVAPKSRLALLIGLQALAPYMTQLAGTGKVDLGFQFFGLCAVLALLNHLESPNARRAALVGGLAAAHFGCKYFGVFLIGALGLRLAWRRKPTEVLAFAAAALGPNLPLLARNFRMKGNPLYPAKFLGLRYDEFLAPYSDFRSAPEGFETVGASVKSVFERLIVGGVVEGAGPLLAAALPLGAWWLWTRRKRVPAARELGLITLLYLALFVPMYPYGLFPRYYAMVFLLLGIAAALALDEHAGKRRAWLAAALLFPGLFLPAAFASLRVKFLLGLESEERFLEARWRNCEPWDMRNRIRALPKGSQILFTEAGQAPVYHYPDHDPVSLARFRLDFYKTAAPERAAAELRKARIGWVLTCAKPQYPRLSDGAIDYPIFGFQLRWFVDDDGTNFKKIYSAGPTDLYEVLPRD